MSNEFNEIILYSSPTQKELLEGELSGLPTAANIILLAGPSVAPDGFAKVECVRHQDFETILSGPLKSFINGELRILTDNLTWPVLLKSRVHSVHWLGHFSWLAQRSEFRKRANGEHSWKRLYDNQRFDTVIALDPWASPELPELLQGDLYSSIQLPRYTEVETEPASQPAKLDELGKENDTETIWIAQGTTGRAELPSLLPAKWSKRETNRMSALRKPDLVVGRPGLGTIRDCLHFGVPLLPIDFLGDQELENNVRVLERFGLVRRSYREKIESASTLGVLAEVVIDETLVVSYSKDAELWLNSGKALLQDSSLFASSLLRLMNR